MTRIPIISRLALRLLLSHSRRLIVTTIGAALCVAVAVVAVSMIGGLDRAHSGRLLATGAHLTVGPGDVQGRRSDLLLDAGPMTGAVELGRTAARADRIRLRNIMSVLRSIERSLGDRLAAASPYLTAQVIATYGPNESVLQLKGVMPEREARLSDLDRAMMTGSVKRLAATRYGILLGHSAARELGARQGNPIRIVSMTGDILNVEVVGIYDLGVEAADRGGLVNLRLAQTIERALPSEGTAIAIQVRHPLETASIARQIERVSHREVATWQQTAAGGQSTFGTLRIVLFSIAVFALTIAGLAIASSLIASSFEDRFDIAALRTVGLSSRGVALAYLLQGVFIAFGACLAGSILGAVMIGVLSMLPAAGAGGDLVLELATLPVAWSAPWFAAACAGMLVAGLAGAVLPARSAALRAPADVLREHS